MIKAEFEYEGKIVIAYANCHTGKDVVVKYVDDEGNRIYPRFTSKQRDEIEELAMEAIQNEEVYSELYF